MSDYPPPPPPPPSSPPPPPPGYGYGGYGPPPPRPFSVGDAYGFGWKAFWRNAGPFVLVALLMWVVEAVLQGVGGALSGEGLTSSNALNGTTSFSAGASGISFLFSVLAAIANVFFNAAMVRGALDVADGRPVTVSTMFERWDKGAVLVAALIVGVLTIVGLVLCILPGLVFAFLAWFTTLFVVDRGMPAWDGVKASVSFTSANVGPLLLCALLGFVVLLVGALLCLVGLLAASPIVTLATAYAYRALQGQPVAAA